MLVLISLLVLGFALTCWQVAAPASSGSTPSANPESASAPTGQPSPGTPAPTYRPEEVAVWKRGHEQYAGFTKDGWNDLAAAAAQMGLTAKQIVDALRNEGAEPEPQSQPSGQPAPQPWVDPRQRPITVADFQGWQEEQARFHQQQTAWQTERAAVQRELQAAGLPVEGEDFEEAIRPAVDAAIDRALRQANAQPGAAATAEQVKAAVANVNKRLAGMNFDALKAAAARQAQTTPQTLTSGATPASSAASGGDDWSNERADQAMQESMAEITRQGQPASQR
jgi:hypothetical protein